MWHEQMHMEKRGLGFKALLQKWGAIHQPKSLWDFESEISSLHFTDFTLVKVISL